MELILLTIIGISISVILSIYRIIVGPTLPDKIVASQAIGTSILAILILIAVMHGQIIFIDIAITYAILLFIVIIAVARYLEMGYILK